MRLKNQTASDTGGALWDWKKLLNTEKRKEIHMNNIGDIL